MITKEEFIFINQPLLITLFYKCKRVIKFLNECINSNMLPTDADLEKVSRFGTLDSLAKECRNSLKSLSFFNIQYTGKFYEGYISLYNLASKEDIDKDLSRLEDLVTNIEEYYSTLETAKSKEIFIKNAQESLWSLASLYNIIIQYLNLCLTNNSIAEKKEINLMIKRTILNEHEFKCNFLINCISNFNIIGAEKLTNYKLIHLIDIKFLNIQEALNKINENKKIAKEVYDALEASK